MHFYRYGELLLDLLTEPVRFEHLGVGEPGVNPLLDLVGAGNGVRALHAAIGQHRLLFGRVPYLPQNVVGDSGCKPYAQGNFFVVDNAPAMGQVFLEVKPVHGREVAPSFLEIGDPVQRKASYGLLRMAIPGDNPYAFIEHQPIRVDSPGRRLAGVPRLVGHVNTSFLAGTGRECVEVVLYLPGTYSLRDLDHDGQLAFGSGRHCHPVHEAAEVVSQGLAEVRYRLTRSNQYEEFILGQGEFLDAVTIGEPVAVPLVVELYRIYEVDDLQVAKD